MNQIKDLVAAIQESAADPRLRYRQGVVQSVEADGTCTITIGGSTTSVAGVFYASHVCPIPGASVWIATDGRDLFVANTLAPTGPAYGTMRKSTTQSIGTGAFTALSWASRTDTVTAGVTLSDTGLVIVVPGLYQVTGAASFTANATGQRHSQLWLNGAVAIQGTGHDAAAGSDVTRLRADGIVKCVAGDVLNLAVYQSSGASLTTNVLNGGNLISAVWLGPTA